MPPKFVRRNNASTSSSSASSSSDEVTSSNSSSTDESSTSEDSSSSDEEEQNTSPNRKPPQPPRITSANSQQPVTKKVESDSSDDSSSEDEDDKDERACTALIRGVMFRVESKIEEQEEKEAVVANSMLPSQPTATSIVPNNSQPTNNSQVFPLTSTSSQRPPKPPTPPPFVNPPGVRTNAAPSPSPLKTQLTDTPTTTTNSVPPIPMNSAAQAAPEDNSYLRDDKEEDDGAVSNLIAKVLSVIAAADTIAVSDPEMPKSQKVVEDTETEESEDETETFIPNKITEVTMPSEKEGIQNQSQEPAVEPPAAVPSPSPQSRMVPSDTETEDSTESDDSTEVDSSGDEGKSSRPPASQQHKAAANTSAQSAEVAEVTMPANLGPSNSIELPPAPSTNEVATDAGNGTLTVSAPTEQPVESTATSSSSQDGDTSVSRSSEPIKAEEDEITEAVVTNSEGADTPKDNQAADLQAVNDEVIAIDHPPLNELVDEAAASHPAIVDSEASRKDQSNDNADAAKDTRSIVSAMAAAVDELQSNTTTETHTMHDTESTQEHQLPGSSDENTHVNQALLPEAVAHGDTIINKESIDIEAKTFDSQETLQEEVKSPISASQDQTSDISKVGEAAPQTGPVDQSPMEAGNEDQKEASNDEGTPLAGNASPVTLNANEDVKLDPQLEAKENADDETTETVIKTDSSEPPIERAPEESAIIAPDSAVEEAANADTSTEHVNSPSFSHPNDKEIANEVPVPGSTPSKIEASLTRDNVPLATVAVPTADTQDSQEHTKIDQKLTEPTQQVVELEPHPNSTTLPQQHAIPSPVRVERGTETAESSPLLNKSVEEKASQTIGFEINAIGTQNEAPIELRSPLSQPSSAPLSSPTREAPPITAPNRQLGKSALSPPRRAMSSPSRQPPSDTASKLKQIAAIRNARSPSKEQSAADSSPIEPTENNQNLAAPDTKAHRSLKPLPAPRGGRKASPQPSKPINNESKSEMSADNDNTVATKAAEAALEKQREAELRKKLAERRQVPRFPRRKPDPLPPRISQVVDIFEDGATILLANMDTAGAKIYISNDKGSSYTLLCITTAKSMAVVNLVPGTLYYITAIPVDPTFKSKLRTIVHFNTRPGYVDSKNVGGRVAAPQSTTALSPYRAVGTNSVNNAQPQVSAAGSPIKTSTSRPTSPSKHVAAKGRPASPKGTSKPLSYSSSNKSSRSSSPYSEKSRPATAQSQKSAKSAASRSSKASSKARPGSASPLSRSGSSSRSSGSASRSSSASSSS